MYYTYAQNCIEKVLILWIWEILELLLEMESLLFLFLNISSYFLLFRLKLVR